MKAPAISTHRSGTWQAVDKNPARHFGSPPAPESTGFRSWLSRLINYLTGTFGEKLNCSRLNQILDSVFSPQEGWDKGEHFECGGVMRTAWRSKSVAGITYYVTAPAHDLAEENSVQAQLSGGRSVAQTLEALKKVCPEGAVKALIPVAQSNTFGYFGPRGHFVLLETTISNGKIESAILHDSKEGLVDTLYNGGKHLTKQLRQKASLGLDEKFSVTVEHRSEQSLLNDKDCGRYTTHYAATIVQDGDLSNTSEKDAQAFFRENL